MQSAHVQDARPAITYATRQTTRRECIHSQNRPHDARPRTKFIHKIIRRRKTSVRVRLPRLTPPAVDDLSAFHCYSMLCALFDPLKLYSHQSTDPLQHTFTISLMYRRPKSRQRYNLNYGSDIIRESGRKKLTTVCPLT